MSNGEALRVETKSVQRTLKELDAYVKDERKQRDKVEELRARLKQQEAVLEETAKMIPVAKQNLNKYCLSLQAALDKCEETGANIKYMTEGTSTLREISAKYPDLAKTAEESTNA